MYVVVYVLPKYFDFLFYTNFVCASLLLTVYSRSVYTSNTVQSVHYAKCDRLGASVSRDISFLKNFNLILFHSFMRL